MKLYKLPIVLYEPSEDTNDMFLAEVPLLPGCRAWGDTPSLALEYVQGVAEAFIESYLEHGDRLPAEVEALALNPEGLAVHTEITVAA
jgi:predicted RNase H-like HicB family nuclease